MEFTNFEDMNNMVKAEQRKTIALDILKKLIEKQDSKMTQSDMRYLVGNAIYMTDYFLKQIEE